MEGKRLLQTFSILERKVFPHIKKGISVTELVKKTGLQEVEVMRALQWMGNKNVITKESVLEPKIKIFLTLSQKAIKYAEDTKLPERRFIDLLRHEKKQTQSKLQAALKMDPSEFGAVLGIAKKEGWITLHKEKELELHITDKGIQSTTLSDDELFFKKICQGGKIEKSLAHSSEQLKKRGLIEEKEESERFIYLTPLGESLQKEKIPTNVVDRITPETLASQSWKGKEFRAYDINAAVPKAFPGKRHFVDQSIRSIKQIWLDLGFQEMEGTLLQTSFWDLDALFVPQDHPAREMQDTFFVKDKKQILQGTLPSLAKKIKAVHETGADTGSEGWGGSWKESIAQEVMLRTHTTALSAKTLSELKKEDLPKKFFTVGKVFRNETLDWKHLFEFYQVEGIVVDPNANLRNLLGYLKEFFKKMGYPDVQIRPSFFGYTEPSAEIFVFHPIKKEWVEVGGAGIFRPEVTKPLLGFECPVLAWGFGMERIITSYYKIQDLREIYKNDLKQLREMKEFL